MVTGIVPPQTGRTMLSYLLCLLTSAVSARRETNPTRVPKNAVLLSKVASLTLRAGRLTSSRRVDPIPQLTCTGPEEICKLHHVDLMRCKNDGADYDSDNIQWSCRASLPEDFKLGSTDVICEGYESGEDPYILKGSCGVEYRLILTDKGEAKYRSYLSRPSPSANRPVKSGSDSTFDIWAIIFGLIFFAVLCVILRSIWTTATRQPPRLGGGVRGDNGDDSDDPPPPYDGPPSYSATPKKQTASRSTSAYRSGPRSRVTGSRNEGPRTADQPRQGSWRPGFWTGAATGAAAAGAGAAYLTRGSQSRSQNDQSQGEREAPSNIWSNSASISSFPPRRSAPSPSREHHESTGFGGTRRR